MQHPLLDRERACRLEYVEAAQNAFDLAHGKPDECDALLIVLLQPFPSIFKPCPCDPSRLKRLGVEGMAVYNHVPGKAALHAGIGELLWVELERSAEPGSDWRRSMGALAAAVRRLAREHPNAYQLLLTPGSVSPVPGLRLFASQLDALQAAGYDETRAAEILRAVFSYACGYAMMELSSFCLDCGSSGGAADFDTILALSRTLPADLPPHLAHVARVVCLATDLDQQFELGLEALLAGFEV